MAPLYIMFLSKNVYFCFRLLIKFAKYCNIVQTHLNRNFYSQLSQLVILTPFTMLIISDKKYILEKNDQTKIKVKNDDKIDDNELKSGNLVNKDNNLHSKK